MLFVNNLFANNIYVLYFLCFLSSCLKIIVQGIIF